jgi:hypothetical protein
MDWTWISNPPAVYAGLVVGMTASVYLFYSAKRELMRLKRQWAEEKEGLSGRLDSFRASLDRLQDAIREEAAGASSETPDFPEGGAGGLYSIQQSKRSQVLRMHRRGEPAEQIAATLHLPRNDVELMLKVRKAAAGES